MIAKTQKNCCKNCHFLSKKTAWPDYHSFSWDDKEREELEIPEHYTAAECYKGIWSTGIDPHLGSKLKEILLIDRKDKGVLFDTNRSWDENSIWYMVENSRVAAFGKAKRFVNYVKPGDIIFYSDSWMGGLVAAARVKGDIKDSPEDDASYRNVDFLTPYPKREGRVWNGSPGMDWKIF